MSEETTSPQDGGTAAGGAADQDGGTAGTAPTTPTPTSSAPSQPEQPVQGDENWESRYKGATRVISEKDKQIAQLRAQLGELTESGGSMSAQLEALRAERTTVESTLNEKLQALTGERDKAVSELGEARAQVMKFNALKEHPDLLPLADAIPSMTDEAALTSYIEMMAKGVTDIATQKAHQLTAGMTPGALAPSDQKQYSYSSLGEWQAALNEAAGDPDTFAGVAKAFRQWESSQT